MQYILCQSVTISSGYNMRTGKITAHGGLDWGDRVETGSEK